MGGDIVLFVKPNQKQQAIGISRQEYNCSLYGSHILFGSISKTVDNLLRCARGYTTNKCFYCLYCHTHSHFIANLHICAKQQIS